MFRWITGIYKSWKDWRSRVNSRKGDELMIKGIREMLAQRGIGFSFVRLYFIGGIEYRDATDEELVRDAIHRKDFAYLRSSTPPSPTSDHLLVYLLSGNDNEAMLLGMTSPYELWERDVIFALQECSIDECTGFLDQEVGKYMPQLPNHGPES